MDSLQDQLDYIDDVCKILDTQLDQASKQYTLGIKVGCWFEALGFVVCTSEAQC